MWVVANCAHPRGTHLLLGTVQGTVQLEIQTRRHTSKAAENTCELIGCGASVRDHDFLFRLVTVLC